MSNEIAANRSTLKEFLASIATISGDLSNITAPPFVLAENSTVEIPQYWADHALLFVAPAAEPEAEKRALLVLKWFLGSLRNQQYAGRKEAEGVKKPLNAFLGELFLGAWTSAELGETRLVAEQVSHHPPITACYLWNDKHGIRAQGFTQQEITFSGTVHIKQKGYAVLHIDKYNEDYLIPVPNVKVKGILSGVPYPELDGEYSLVSSTGYISHVKFEGKGFFGSGQKNAFHARVFHKDQPKQDLYTIKGAWNGNSVITRSASGGAEEQEEVVENFDVMKLPTSTIEVADLAEQDAWESRRAWGQVIAALRRGDMQGTTNAKSVVEKGQRQMRKDEAAQGAQWKSVFFQKVDHDALLDTLGHHDDSFTVDPAGGIWKVDPEAIKTAKKPYHGHLLPTNDGAAAEGVEKSARSGQNSPKGAPHEHTTDTKPSASVPKHSAPPTHSSDGIKEKTEAQQQEEEAKGVKDEAQQQEEAEGVRDEAHNGKDSTWKKTLADSVNQIASKITSQTLGPSKTTAAEESVEKVAPQEQTGKGALDSQAMADDQVEDFLRARQTANA